VLPRVTIAIITLNRAPYLRRALESLRYLDYPNFEVVVVNGPSEDDTESVLDEFRNDVRIGRCDAPNVAVSRNISLYMAQGDIVATMDDDCVAEYLWLSRLLAGFDREEVAAVGGPIFGPTGQALQYGCVTCDRFSLPTYRRDPPSDLYSVPSAREYPSLLGGNAAFRRRVLVEIGGFDEEYEYYLEETDLCARIVDAGYAVKYVPDAFVHHKHAPSLHYRNEQSGLFNRYPVIKNHLYFGLKFLQDYSDGSLERVIKDSLDFAEEQRKSMDNECKRGVLTNEDVDRFSSHAEQALFEGLRRGLFRERKLLRPEKITEYSSPYKPFRTLLPKEARISLCIINRFFESPEADVGAAFDRELASAAAALGHNVHVLTLGAHESTSDFEDGIWVHRIVPGGPPKPAPPWFPNVPDALWRHSWAMYEEVVRVSERQHIHILQWSINDLGGIASLMEQRFVNVLSLLSISESAMWQYSEKGRPVRMKRSMEELVRAERFCLKNVPYLLLEGRSVVDSVSKRLGLTIPDLRICRVDSASEVMSPGSSRVEWSVEHVIDFYREIVRRRYGRTIPGSAEGFLCRTESTDTIR
jgi:glycogen(starch) synthase